jgi:hypothetical protein
MFGEHVFQAGIIHVVAQVADVQLLTHASIPFEENAATPFKILGRKEMDQCGGPPSRDGEGKTAARDYCQSATEIEIGKPDGLSIAARPVEGRPKAAFGRKKIACGTA